MLASLVALKCIEWNGIPVWTHPRRQTDRPPETIQHDWVRRDSKVVEPDRAYRVIDEI